MTSKKSSQSSNGAGGLEYVTPTADPHLNILLYGPPKTGKTMGAASAPGPVLYLNADTPQATRYAHASYPGNLKEARVTGLDTLFKAAEAVEAGEFKSVVVDPVSDVHRVILEQLSGRALSPQIQQYGDTSTHLERFCRWLCEQPVNAIFVCHETSVKDESSGQFERLPYTGTNNPAIGAKLMAVVDVIGYTGVVEGEGDEAPKYMATLVNSRGRRGGDRFGVLGQARETNLSEWVELAREIAPKQAQEAKA